ncbi:hypothetical protein ACFQY5_02655 [Paeniroseomonas aquatica]
MGILALLNCKLMTWCLRVMNPEAGEALAEVKKEFVELLPIPNPTNLGHLEKIATSIIKLKTGPQSVVVERQIKMHIRQIDAAVYALFGLTSDEVELLERRLT